MEKLIRKIWPVEKSERTKVFLLILIKFCATFVYSILFVSKDTIIITSPGLGAELIPVLKGTVMVAAAFIVSAIYTRMSVRLSFDKVFNLFIYFFSIFFLIYGFYLYPNRDSLAVSPENMDFLGGLFGNGRHHWLAIFRFWFHSIFFIIAELWGGLVILTLFWGTANTINNVDEASRFYNLFSAGGHLATLIGGFAIGLVSSSNLSYENSLKYLMCASFGLCLVMLYAVKQIDLKFDLSKYKPKKKISVTFTGSLKKILTSKYLLAVCFIVVGYSFTMNMVEVYWKDSAKVLYSSSSQFQLLLGRVISLIGFFSLLMSVFLSGNLIRSWGWKKSSLLCPICIACVAGLFFGFHFMSRSNVGGSDLADKFMVLAVFLGAGHNIIAKILKYSLFDPTKEIAYIPLSYEEKVNGKAAIDVMSSRLGKSGSSWLQILAMELLGTAFLVDTAAYMMPILFLGFASWIWAIFYISKTMEASKAVENH